jgi:hypothetical protein
MKELDHLEEPNINKYTSPIISNLKNVDLISFKVQTIYKDKSNQQEDSRTYDFWLKGGLKIDFSVGFFASGLTDNQFNKLPYYVTQMDSTDDGAGNIKYSSSIVANSDSFYISKTRNGNFSFCFGGMVNIIPRNGSRWINAGLSVGVAYSTNQRLQALTAFSLHLGKTERLILHGGAAFGTVKQLDVSRLNLLQDGPVKRPDHTWFVRGDINNFTVPEIERFCVRPFFGLSYNLSKQNALQAVKSQPGFKHYNAEL